MPRVRMSTSVAGAGYTAQVGDELDLSPEQAAEAVAAGWGEIVRDDALHTPEGRAAPIETTVIVGPPLRQRPATSESAGAMTPIKSGGK